MATTIAQKLKIKEGYTILSLNAPAGFARGLEPLPKHVIITENGNSYHQVHWFVKNKAQLDKEINMILSLIKDDVLCWVYYPKGTSKMQTDLTRDKGWDSLLNHDEFTWISLISFD